MIKRNRSSAKCLLFSTKLMLSMLEIEQIFPLPTNPDLEGLGRERGNKTFFLLLALSTGVSMTVTAFYSSPMTMGWCQRSNIENVECLCNGS